MLLERVGGEEGEKGLEPGRERLGRVAKNRRRCSLCHKMIDTQEVDPGDDLISMPKAKDTNTTWELLTT